MYLNFQELSVALNSNWAILPVTVGVHLVNFVDHSGQFAHLTTVPAQFTISKTWHAASLTPHWTGGGLPPCEKRVTMKTENVQKNCHYKNWKSAKRGSQQKRKLEKAAKGMLVREAPRRKMAVQLEFVSNKTMIYSNMFHYILRVSLNRQPVSNNKKCNLMQNLQLTSPDVQLL